ncbi:bacterioferritin [uncultured Cohaesibacter sp.]|uniref:bacterioferritin n=1 Tax=uncultured Cohaesibacter sp. TaxID=1002546 RepID=UPI002931246B|nr:bacterioferritin [uncultured Cohaesibacter sp.]
MKGNEKVIEYLNKGLRSELTAVNQYWLHYRLLDDWGFSKMAAKWRAESIEEMQHADKFIERILFLEGHPNLQHLDPLKIGQGIREILQSDLEGEQDARALYKEGRDVCHEAGDYISMKLFEELMADEEGHIDYLETQLNLFDTLGKENYAQLQAGDAGAAED